MFNTRFNGFAFVMLSMLVSANAFGIEAVWIGGPAGSWSEPTNWSSGVLPSGAATNATIDANPAQSTSVVLDVNSDFGGLTLDAGDALHIANGVQAATDATTIVGTLSVGATGRLNPSEYLWVQPTGRVELTDHSTQSGSWIQAIAASVWNQGVISGAGRLSSFTSLYNEGQVIANIDNKSLQLHPSQGQNYVNAGQMFATDGGNLEIAGLFGSPGSVVLQNYSGTTNGLIQAHPGSRATLSGLVVTGGQISSVAGEDGMFGEVLLHNLVLNGVRLEGEILGSQLVFQNTIVNNAKLSHSPYSMSSPFVSVSSTTTLTGTGRMEMHGTQIQGAFSLTPTPRLTNEAGHTIAGPGTIGGSSSPFRLVNRGLIESISSSFIPSPNLTVHVSTAATTPTTNSGVMRARDAAKLTITGNGTTFANFEGDKPGLIEADVNSTVQFTGILTIEGGVLRAVSATPAGTDNSGKIMGQGSGTTSPLLKNVRLEGAIGDALFDWRLHGDIENTGELVGSNLYIESAATLTGGGVVRLPNNTTIRSQATGNTSLLINEDNSIVGSGRIETGSFLSFINRGSVNATSSTTPMQIGGMTNSGLLQAIGGATLTGISGSFHINNREGDALGMIHAGDASKVIVNSVNGGILSSTGSGEIQTQTTSSNIFADIENRGKLVVRGTTRFSGVIVNNGNIFADTSTVQNVNVVSGLTRFTGTGQLGSSDAGLNIAVGNNSPAFLVNGPQHTIRSGGNIRVLNGVFINEGSLIPDTPQLTIDILEGASIVQRGTILVQSGKLLDLTTRGSSFGNQGLLDIAGEATFRRGETGSLEVVNEPGAKISLRGTMKLDVPNVTGARTVLWNRQGANLTGKGSIDFSVGGQITGLLSNSGLMRLEGEVAELGRLNINGDFIQDATGSLEMNVAGVAPGEFDSLILAGGNAQLGGTLEVNPIATFDPPAGHEYTLIDTQGGTVAGVFDSVELPALAGRWWSLDYQTDKVVLGVYAITADFDGNGYVDGDDLDDWQLASQNGTAGGDSDGDGDSDGRDFLTWQRQFGAGINPNATSVAVPEPAGVILLLIGMSTLAMRRTA
jgi:hypothetical protein